MYTIKELQNHENCFQKIARFIIFIMHVLNDLKYKMLCRTSFQMSFVKHFEKHQMWLDQI